MRSLLNQTQDKLSTRDSLAIQRTVLGNTRTFFAVIRTAIALLAVGAGFLRFALHTFFHIMGHILIVLSVIVMILGILDFNYFRRKIDQIMRVELDKLETPEPDK